MPFISAKVTTKISPKQENELKSKLGETMSILGKSENWLMISFEENCNLYFSGNKDGDCAYIVVALFGKATKSAFDKMTEKVTFIFNSILNIPSNRIYIKYEEVDNWGWNGSNF